MNQNEMRAYLGQCEIQVNILPVCQPLNASLNNSWRQKFVKLILIMDRRGAWNRQNWRLFGPKFSVKFLIPTAAALALSSLFSRCSALSLNIALALIQQCNEEQMDPVLNPDGGSVLLTLLSLYKSKQNMIQYLFYWNILSYCLILWGNWDCL